MNASSTIGATRAERATPMSAEPAIQVDGLDFSYGGRPALRAVGFTIARGEIFGFLGPNGGGKSTLFRLLSTLVPIQSGSVRILGHDLRGATQALRRRIGVVFQIPASTANSPWPRTSPSTATSTGCAARGCKERTQAMLGAAGRERSRARPGRDAFGWTAPAGRAGQGAPARARTAVARRAEHRTRPCGAARVHSICSRSFARATESPSC